MTREIKFRAWDRSSNQMMDVGEVHYCHGGVRVEGTGVHIGNGWASLKNGNKQECDVALMQFTGLKDKNGKEIYEGDIMQTKDSVAPGVVEYITSGFKVGGVLGTPLSYWRKEKIEIIGNIHENPVLLTKEPNA